MAYGKLEIYWPDGPYDSFWLDKDTVAVGRSPGNDVVLDTTSVSRYHITLSRVGNVSALELRDLESVNGTYIDGDRVKPNEPYKLYGGEEVMVGDLRLIYIPNDEEHDTKPIDRSRFTTTQLKAIQASFRLDVEPPGNVVAPGAHNQALLTITNLSDKTETFTLEVEGLPPEWVRADRHTIELDSHQVALVGVTFKPLRRSDSKPGDYTVKFRVRASALPEQPLESELRLTVLAYSGFGIALASDKVDQVTPFGVYIHNQGSAPLNLFFSAQVPDKSLIVTFATPKVTLAPGERQLLQGNVQPRRQRLVGGVVEKRFDILAHSQDSAGFVAAVQGTFVEKARLPEWVRPILGIGGALAVALALTLIISLIRPQRPSITAFEIGTVPLYRNVLSSLPVSWQVTNARSAALEFTGLSESVPSFAGRSPSDSILVTGAFQNGALIRLVVTGHDGRTETLVEQQLIVQSPRCRLTQTIGARQGPAETYPISQRFAADAELAVDRIDPSKLWLRDELTRAWLPLESLLCLGFSPLNLVSAAALEIPPTVTATMTPLPTATPTFTATPIPATPTTPATMTPQATPTATLVPSNRF